MYSSHVLMVEITSVTSQIERALYSRILTQDLQVKGNLITDINLPASSVFTFKC